MRNLTHLPSFCRVSKATDAVGISRAQYGWQRKRPERWLTRAESNPARGRGFTSSCSTTQRREKRHGNLDARPYLLPLAQDGDAGSRGKARLRGALEPRRQRPTRRPRRDGRRPRFFHLPAGRGQGRAGPGRRGSPLRLERLLRQPSAPTPRTPTSSAGTC
jgi:hypothetical protein